MKYTVPPEPVLPDLLNKVASEIPNKWKLVGIALNIDLPFIRSVEESQTTSQERYIEIFDKWKKSLSKPYTWLTIIDALESPSVDENRLAQKLREEFGHQK